MSSRESATPFFNRHRGLLFLKGMAMGAADSVPGVSGGTVALITNIYEELIDAIKSLGLQTLVVWKKEGFKAAWKYINGSFLLTLLSGILVSLSLLGRIILVLLENYLPYLLAFFAGLVLASIRFVADNISRWSPGIAGLFLLGAALSVFLAFFPMSETGDSLVYFFFCGAIAICAMILPGISGAFILVLLGAYGPVLEALTQFNFQVISVFALGCLCGLMLFSRLLSWVLHHYHNAAMATLTGMLAGSLYLLWPWRLVSQINLSGHDFDRYEHVMPETYAQVTGTLFSPYISIGLLIFGAVLVLMLEVIAKKVQASHSNLVDQKEPGKQDKQH